MVTVITVILWGSVIVTSVVQRTSGPQVSRDLAEGVIRVGGILPRSDIVLSLNKENRHESHPIESQTKSTAKALPNTSCLLEANATLPARCKCIHAAPILDGALP